MPTRPAIKRRSGLPSLYTRLDPDRSLIRLFAFEADSDGNVTGTLTTHDPADARQRPEWIALSYTWDLFEVSPHSPVSYRNTQETLYRISVNGHKIAIRPNLYQALLALNSKRNDDQARKPDDNDEDFEVEDQFGFDSKYFGFAGSLRPRKWRYFWIDAICVNQNDVDERQHQIGLMNRIFSQANSVISWLTPYQAESKTDTRTTLMRVLEERKDGESLTQQETNGLRRYSLSPRMNVSDGELHHRAIVHNAYWQRMWIVQEVILARRITCLYGSTWLTETFLREIIGKDSSPANQILRHREAFHRARRRRGTFDFQELIDSYSFKQCSDVRDRIYALLGLLPVDFPITPDYSLSSTQIFLLLLEFQGGDATALHTRSWYLALNLDWRDPVVESHLWLHTHRKSRQKNLVVAESGAMQQKQAVPSLLNVLGLMILWFHHRIVVPVWLIFLGVAFKGIDMTFGAVLQVAGLLQSQGAAELLGWTSQAVSDVLSSLVTLIKGPEEVSSRENVKRLSWKSRPD